MNDQAEARHRPKRRRGKTFADATDILDHLNRGDSDSPAEVHRRLREPIQGRTS